MIHPDLVFDLDVGYTTQRPVIPDQHTRQVLVLAQDPIEAALTAHAMVYGHRSVVMVTRLTVTRCVA